MHADLRDRWCAALRSGAYQQGKGVLKTADGHHCCLGVLASLEGDLAATATVHGYLSDKLKCHALVTDASLWSVLPSDLLDKYGLDAPVASTLMSMNDSGDSFPVIADWIEKNL